MDEDLKLFRFSIFFDWIIDMSCGTVDYLQYVDVFFFISLFDRIGIDIWSVVGMAFLTLTQLSNATLKGFDCGIRMPIVMAGWRGPIIIEFSRNVFSAAHWMHSNFNKQNTELNECSPRPGIDDKNQILKCEYWLRAAAPWDISVWSRTEEYPTENTPSATTAPTWCFAQSPRIVLARLFQRDSLPFSKERHYRRVVF